jgi:hypothetical protein
MMLLINHLQDIKKATNELQIGMVLATTSAHVLPVSVSDSDF